MQLKVKIQWRRRFNKLISKFKEGDNRSTILKTNLDLWKLINYKGVD